MVMIMTEATTYYPLQASMELLGIGKATRRKLAEVPTHSPLQASVLMHVND